MYADYKFYTDEYHGAAIPSASFDLYAGMAGDYITSATLGRATSDNEQVLRCECRLAEILYLNDEASADRNAQKTSEKVGDYSVAYADRRLSESELGDKITATIYRYLAYTGLLYRGVR